jgi:hypothetical protein
MYTFLKVKFPTGPSEKIRKKACWQHHQTKLLISSLDSTVQYCICNLYGSDVYGRFARRLAQKIHTQWRKKCTGLASMKRLEAGLIRVKGNLNVNDKFNQTRITLPRTQAVIPPLRPVLVFLPGFETEGKTDGYVILI